MQFNVLTLFPNLFTDFEKIGVIGKAFEKDIAHLNLVNPRDFTTDKHRSVDKPPFGGGDGMLIMADPLAKAVDSLSAEALVINVSPQGKKWNQQEAKKIVDTHKQVTFVCGRYAGVDQRFINKYVDIEYSIGDYVISGGELVVQILIDSMMRLLPGTLGHNQSAIEDSFSDHLLEAPQFTQPRETLGQSVPEVLLSGHHKNIKKWNEVLSYGLTYFKRKDLLLGQVHLSEQVIESLQILNTYSDDELFVLGFKPDHILELRSLKEKDIQL